MRCPLAFVALLVAGVCHADVPIELLEIHPVLARTFTTSEHWAGQLDELGDALGSDCIAQELIEDKGRMWLRAYKHDGKRNEDWYGWRQPVLAPITGVVEDVHVNPTTNPPGIMTPGVASSITIRRDDDVHVMLAHVQDIVVKVGDHVTAGQVLAKVGNNGYARHPHIHVGAWRANVPLQLRFDLAAMAELARKAEAGTSH